MEGAPRFLTILEQLKNSKFRSTIPQETLLTILMYFQNYVANKDFDSAHHCLRVLRIACLDCSRNQNLLIGSVPAAMEVIQEVLTDGERIPVLVRVLQFLANLTNKNRENLIVVWREIEPILMVLLQHGDEGVLACACILVNSTAIVLPDRLMLLPDEKHPHLVIALVEASLREIEFGLFALERLLCEAWLLCKVYSTLKPNYREFILDTIASQGCLCPESVEYFVRVWKNHADDILKSNSDRLVFENGVEIHKQLEVLGHAAGDDKYRKYIVPDRDLVMKAMFILRMVHQRGKLETSEWVPQAHLTAFVNPPEDHPTFGFKAGLVRLIGNCVYRNKENQNMSREFDIIPIILECTCMDAKNPYITQWAVLAIRNLAEGNKENQALLKSLQLKTGARQAALIDELHINLDGDKAKVNVGTKRKS